MRRRLALWILSGLVLAGGGTLATASPSVASEAHVASIEASAAVHRAAQELGIGDEAAMVLVGTILIGLAGAVRRAA